MKQTIVMTIAVFLLVIGCTSRRESSGAMTLVQLAHENQSNIARLTVGIQRPAVVELMGTKIARTGDGPVSNPFRSEIFQDKANNQYEVLYYVVERNRRFQPLRLSQTTPVILKNRVVIGWGEESLRQAKELATKEGNPLGGDASQSQVGSEKRSSGAKF